MSAALKLGWGITQDQHSLFWHLWNSACRYQQWTTSEANVKRHEILAELGFASAKHIDSTDGFDRVKKRFQELAGKVHNERADAGQRRRILSRIGLVFAELSEAEYPARSLDTILRKRFKLLEGSRRIGDLETPELVNLLSTVSARLTSWKQRQELVRLLRLLFTGMALFNAWPIKPAQAAPRSARSLTQASAMHTLCSVNAADLPGQNPAPFFFGD